MSFERRIEIILEHQLKFPINNGGASFGEAIHPKVEFDDMKKAVKRCCYGQNVGTKRKNDEDQPKRKKPKSKFTKEQKAKIQKYQNSKLDQLHKITQSSNRGKKASD